MNNAGFSEESPKSSPKVNEDIPAALRDTPDAGESKSNKFILLTTAGVAIFAILTLATIIGLNILGNSSDRTVKKNSSSESDNSLVSGQSANSSKKQNDTLVGHFQYSEAPSSELTRVSGQIKLRKPAALKYQEMVRNARQAGVNLALISGFRSEQTQNQLFFEIGARRGQVPTQRASVSAPPGYSEHHTGYAVDIGDGNVPATNLSPKFENTKAFKWLQKNAARYGFELSFPRDNPQGVSYEPWHWRFVGDRHSLETFYKRKDIKPVQPSE